MATWTRTAVGCIGFVFATLALAAPQRRHPVTVDPAQGVAIFEQGTLTNGEPLVAERANMPSLSGQPAACINCHRKSGLGSVEARSVIPPITKRYLFQSPQDAETLADLPYLPNERVDRDAYTFDTLARAVREGVDSRGHALSYLMPRYDLSDEDMRALFSHLEALDPKAVPGVTSKELHFATIITPDADPTVKAAVLQVMNNFFDEKNRAPRGPGDQKMLTSAKGAAAKHMFRVNRLWVLHVWELTGPPSGWTQQLHERMQSEPVFAVMAGAYGKDFEPVRAFCEADAVPCLFPNLDFVAEETNPGFHSIYYSRGTGIEADMIAHDLGRGETPPASIVQVYREGDVGERAADRLAEQLNGSGTKSISLKVPAKANGAALRALLGRAAKNVPLVLWLRGPDLAELAGAHAPTTPVYVSGVMGGYEEAPVPAEWRAQTKLAFNVDVPEARRVRLDYAHGWFRMRKIPEVAFHEQADTLLTCGIVSETVKHMIDAFIPDYLVERLEDTLEHRLVTGFYPRLTLGPHQRMASKGGYFVRFKNPTGDAVEPVGEWVVP